MKHFYVLLLLTAPLAAQNISLGFRGGVPFTDAFKTSGGPSFNYRSLRNPYTFGPNVEIRLPLRLGITFDVLYKRLGYEGEGSGATVDGRANQFEFPLMGKYRFKPGTWSPYVAAGPSFNRIAGVSRTVRNPGSVVAPEEFRNSSSGGFAFAGGIEAKALVRFTAELRMTRRGTKNFFSAASQLLESNLNQAEFLVGIHF